MQPGNPPPLVNAKVPEKMQDRQMDPRNIRFDHLARYRFALCLCKGPVLDAACGIGYGTHMIAHAGHEVTGVDISSTAIGVAKSFYGEEDAEPKPRWLCGDLMEAPWCPQTFRTVVCMETLEHLPNPAGALKLFRQSMVPGDGRLVCSVPNEEVYPFDAEKFKNDKYPHLRHYTPAEFDTLLYLAGFQVIKRCMQVDKRSPVTAGSNGRFLIYLCMPI